MPKELKKKALIEFSVTFIVVLALFAVSMIKTNVYNRTVHNASFTGSALFSFEIIKSHTVHGGEILSSFKSLKNVGEGALYHHERYDGKGYPEGKAGEDIPLIARMICVADSFDAMNSNRVYRKKLTKEYILNEIEKNKGLQFDPKIADVMLGLLRSGKIDMDFE